MRRAKSGLAPERAEGDWQGGSERARMEDQLKEVAGQRDGHGGSEEGGWVRGEWRAAEKRN